MDVPIEAICSLGVGGVLAILIFIMYRRDRKTSEEQLKQYAEQLRQDRIFMEDRLNNILVDYRSMVKGDQESRGANTKALTELTTVLERMNGRK